MKRLAVIALALCLIGPRVHAADDAASALELGRQGRAIDGLAMIERVLAVTPQDLDARLTQARLLGWAGRNEQAEQAIGRLMADYPDHPQVLALGGSIAWYRGDGVTARQRYAAALAKDPQESEAIDGMAGVGRADKPRWRLDSGFDSSHFSSPTLKDWQDAYTRLGYALDEGTQVHVLGHHSHRFGLIDRYFEAGVSHMFQPWLRGYVAGGGTVAADFLPRRRIDTGGAVRLASDGGMFTSTWGSLDIRHSTYRSGVVGHVAPGVQQYLFDGQVWLTGRFLMMQNERHKHPTGWETRGDWQITDRFRLFAGFSDIPETTANYTAPTTSRFGGVVLGLSDDVDLTLSASRGYPQPRRDTVGMAISVRF